MSDLVFLVALFSTLGTLVAWRVSGIVTAVVMAVLLLIWTISSSLQLPMLLAWAVFLTTALPLVIRPVRKEFLTRWIFALFKKATPTMSRTEREALEAGSVWWDGELFSGSPDWNKLLDYPAPKLTKEESDFLAGPVEELCALLNDWEITNKLNDLPESAWTLMKEKGFFGMIIPKEYGGLGFSALAHSAVVMKISSRSMSAAVTVMVPNSLGPAELLLSYGTDEQKKNYLPGLASGAQIPCFALTNPHAGSDAASIPDTGIVVKRIIDGKEALGLLANFEKRYITLASVATVAGLALNVKDPDGLLEGDDLTGITVVLVPADTAGVTLGRRHNPMGVPFINGPVLGKDVFIPIDWVVGGHAGLGKGWKMLMERLAVGRSISLPALSVGGAKYSSRVTGAYAAVRTQFHMPIGKFEGVEEKLAEIAGLTYMIESARTLTLGAVDSGERPAVISAIMKYSLTEKLRTVINHAMDIHAGSAISLGKRNVMANAYMALPIAITVEGANILTRTLIVFGQGALRSHPYVMREIEAVGNEDSETGLDQFDIAFFAHIQNTAANAIRSLFHGITGSIFAVVPQKKERRMYKRLTRLCAAFAFTADIVMITLGGALKRKEKISGRLADALSHLYLASALLKRFNDDGSPKDDLPLLRYGVDSALDETEKALSGVIDNLPACPVACFLRFVTFPLGRLERGPSDNLGHKVATIILEPSGTRDRLTEGVYSMADPSDSVGRIEDAFNKVVNAEPALRKINLGIRNGVINNRDDFTTALEAGVISQEEVDLLSVAREARNEAITVDDFTTEEMK